MLIRSMLSVLCLINPAFAETVDVKYRGPVPLDTFECPALKSSSFVTRICYDKQNQYLIVLLRNTYYYYCEIDPNSVAAWIFAPSLGRHYNNNIKGGPFDCRGKYVPEY